MLIHQDNISGETSNTRQDKFICTVCFWLTTYFPFFFNDSNDMFLTRKTANDFLAFLIHSIVRIHLLQFQGCFGGFQWLHFDQCEPLWTFLLISLSTILAVVDYLKPFSFFGSQLLISLQSPLELYCKTNMLSTIYYILIQ